MVNARKIKIRPSVHYAPVSEGIYFKNWDKSFVVKGHKTLYVVFERILPFLHQGVELPALLGAVPENVRTVLEALVDKLDDNEMLLNLGDLSASAPSGAEAEAFEQAISYLESTASDPYATFARIRSVRVLAIGSGQGLFAAVRALASLGVGAISCRAPGDECAALRQLLAGHSHIDSNVVAALDDDNGGAAWDAVLQVQHAGELDQVERVAAATSAPLLQAVLGSDYGLVGPLRHRGPGAGLSDALARFRQPLGHDDEVSPIAAGLAGNLAAYELFRFLAGLSSPTQDGRGAVVQVEPLQSSFHPVEPVFSKREPGPEQVRADHHDLRAYTDAPDPEQLATELEPLFDAHFGLVPEPHPHELPQAPLFVFEAAIDPERAPVVGFSDDPQDAHAATLLESCARLAERDAPVELLALSPADETVRTVARQPWMHMAAGYTHDQWLEDGLGRCLAHYLTGHTELPLSPVSRAVSADSLDEGGRLRWRTMELVLSEPVKVLHVTVTELPGVHLSAVVSGDTTWSIGVAHRPGQAIGAALREAAARAQLAATPARLPGRGPVRACDADHGDAGAWDAEGSLSRTLSSLAEAGLEVLVHPWDGEPGIRRRGLLLGWVGLHVR